MRRLRQTSKCFPLWARVRFCELSNLEETKTSEQVGGNKEDLIFWYLSGGKPVPMDDYVCKRFEVYVRKIVKRKEDLKNDRKRESNSEGIGKF